MTMRDLAFIDLETTGLDPARHEIIEAAVIRVDGETLAEIDHTDVRVLPERIEDASPVALRINGYTPDAWKDAASQAQALEWITPLLDGAVLGGHNPGFDRAFLEAACRRTGIMPAWDHHLLDTASLAWPLLASGELAGLSLDAVCAHLGIVRKERHRALADAADSLEVARRMIPAIQQAVESGMLHGDLAPLAARRAGPRLKRRRQRVYVCHPFAGEVEANTGRVKVICRALVERGLLPVAPQLYLPQFLDEATDRDRALELCLGLLEVCDEVRVYGSRISPGMRLEIDHAVALGIPVRFVDMEVA